MNEVRTFRATTMQEALDIVHREMGAEAVILHTRQIAHRRFLPWRKPNQEVEITAGLGVNIRQPVAQLRENQQLTASSASKSCEQVHGVMTPHTHQTGSFSARSVAEQDYLVPGGLSTRKSSAQPSRVQTTRPPFAQLSTPMAEQSLTDRQRPHANHASVAGPLTTSPTAASDPQLDQTATFATQLASIQKMVENLGRIRNTGGTEEIPNELFHLYTDLIDADVEDDLARDLIFRLRQNATPSQLSDATVATALLTGMVESEICCSNPITPTPGQRKVVALVGPTGVGKTTTIAKLAANFRLRDGVKMGLVTVDTYRVAAVEQLRTYAEIIDLPMKVVTSPLEMRRALDELTAMDLLLIDTAGRSPRDELQIQELKTLLAEADVDEVHLVLSLTASVRSLEATAEKFSVANTTSIILTKLDEAAVMGSLLSVARKVPLPISYLTTGQDVPDDIEPANASRIARLVLGQDRLFD